jgi:hypothetical protein
MHSIEGVKVECLSDTASSKKVKVNMLALIDKSGSMADESVYGSSKWGALVGALTTAFEGVEDNPELSIGLALFPASDVPFDCVGGNSCCEVKSTVDHPIELAEESVGPINDILNKTEPGGLTPTSAALDLAYDYFEANQFEGDNYVLLATDGGPNCNSSLDCGMEECTRNLDRQCGDDWETTNCCQTEALRAWCVDHEETRSKIEDLADKGIKTIVVGIPGTEAYTDWLNAFAKAGKAVAPEGESFYEVAAEGGEEALTETFTGITQDLVNSCNMQMSQTPPAWDTSLVNIAIDCKVVPKGGGTTTDDDGNEIELEDNWVIDAETDPPTVVFPEDGEYCQTIKKGVDRVDIVIGCPAVL